MGMPGFRRPLEDEEETHEFSRPPRDFEETEDGSYRFTIGPPDLRPPLTDWLEEGEAVRVDYHTDLDDEAKARFRLRAAEPGPTEDSDWMESPTRVRLEPLEE